MSTNLKLSIGTFALSFNQSKVFKLVYKNKNASIYSIKLPFKKFIMLTIKNK
jgi:hypothetical protein